MYWQKEQECLSRTNLEQLQLQRLQTTLKRVGTNVPFYRNKFNSLNLKPEKLTSLEGIRDYPFTLKQDLRDNYPYGLFAVPLRDVVRVQQ